MFADMVFSSWLGVGAILFPQFFMGHQLTSEKGAKDANSILLYRVYGAQLLIPVLFWYYGRKSRDETVVGSMLWSRALGLVPVLMVMLYGHYTYKTFSDRNLWFFVLCMVCIWLSNVVQLVRSRPSVGRREQKGPVSVIFRIEFLLMFVTGLAAMAFPKMTIAPLFSDPKNFQLHIERLLGSLQFSLMFLAWYAPSFRDNEDRRRFFCMQLTMIVAVLGCTACCWHCGTLTSDQFMSSTLGLSVPTLIPLAGLYFMSDSYQSQGSTKTYFTRSKAS